MAVSLLTREVSDLCLGKPALRSLSISATVADALSALKRSDEPYLSIWSCDHNNNNLPNFNINIKTRGLRCNEENCRCIGKICMVDIVCFLCKEDNLKNLGKVLQTCVAVLVPKVSGDVVKHLEPHARLSEAIDLIVEGAQNLVIPLHSPFTREKLTHKTSSISTLHNGREYCWLTLEDLIRYLLNCIGLFSPIPNHSIESLNIIEAESILAVCYDEPTTSALPLIAQSLVKQTSVAVVDTEGKLIGEISPYALNYCDESVAAAVATLSVGELMAFVDCGDPPEDLIKLVKERLDEKNLGAALELIEEESGISMSSSCSSYSSSSDEEFGLSKSGSFRCHSTRVARRTDAIVCFPWSSLVAVMIQAISHRVSYVWVVEEDGTLVGIVTFTGMMKVFRERLKSMM
ncbi:CBS domain-containing protein CBSX5-like [Mercurialis annua]|uniref:CBS domain-containing protein CBSX5-like n=1 Tax=Mercurialis annua TaxID=3986 RepID=UPI002160FE53|nr:CBS domain-containing protein CBSX5-like [Mercurialis annua]